MSGIPSRVIIDAYSRVVTGFCAPSKASCDLAVVKPSALQHLPELEKGDRNASAHARHKEKTCPYFANFTEFGPRFSAGRAANTSNENGLARKWLNKMRGGSSESHSHLERIIAVCADSL